MRAVVSLPPLPSRGFHVDVAETAEHVALLDGLALAIRRTVPAAMLARQLPGRLCCYHDQRLASRALAWLRAAGAEARIDRWWIDRW